MQFGFGKAGHQALDSGSGKEEVPHSRNPDEKDIADAAFFVGFNDCFGITDHAIFIPCELYDIKLA